MIKEFNRWNISKQKIDRNDRLLNFHEREIWWCSIGVNIGSEQNSQTINFSRPVLILKKFTQNIFLGIPLTTKIRISQFRYRMSVNAIENDLLLMQIRTLDSKRLVRKIGIVDQEKFDRILSEICILFEKTKTPEGVFSEAEASVCNISVADEICLSNEINYLLSRGEFN